MDQWFQAMGLEYMQKKKNKIKKKINKKEKR